MSKKRLKKGMIAMSSVVIPAPNSNVKKADIVNNLTSTATDKPLSAAQGKALNDNLANFINVATKSFSGLSVSSAGGYTKIADYSDLGVALQNIISIADQSRNFSGTISFQWDLGGLYMYCSSSFSNGVMTIRYVYK